MRLKRLFLGVMLLVGITGAGATNAAPEDISASISLKVPGNDAKQYPLALQKMQDGMYSCRASEKLPLDIIRQVVDRMANSALPSHSRRWKMCISTTGNR